MAGEDLHVATADGIRTAVFTIAGGIVATSLLTLAFRDGGEPLHPPYRRRLGSALLVIAADHRGAVGVAWRAPCSG
jgi:hypothetical protein